MRSTIILAICRVSGPACDMRMGLPGRRRRPLARLVVFLARPHSADRLANVVGELKLLLRNELLPLSLRRGGVPLALLLNISPLSSEVFRVDVPVREEDRHTVLGLPARQLELLHKVPEATALLLDVLRGRVVGTRRERPRLLWHDRLRRRRGAFRRHHLRHGARDGERQASTTRGARHGAPWNQCLPPLS